MNEWMNERTNERTETLKSVSGSITGLTLQPPALASNCPPRGAYPIACLLIVSAKKDSNKMTLSGPLPANGSTSPACTASRQAGDFSTGFSKTGLHRTKWVPQGRWEGGWKPFPPSAVSVLARAARMAHLLSGMSSCVHYALVLISWGRCVQRH